MKIRFRLIPITLGACFLFLMLKVDEVAVSQKYLALGMLPPAYAADASDAEAEEEVEEEADEKEADEATEGEEAEPPVDSNPNVSLEAPKDSIEVSRQFNQIEVDLLQSLSKRREEIDLYAEEVTMREKLLEATELRLDEKIQQMSDMKTELQELLDKNKEVEDKEMQSLVKIYESMKPKEAARIFNELDMEILLDVIDRMSERKAAAILANMLPTTAKDVTVKLAEMRQLRKQVKNDLANEGIAQ